MPNELTGHHVLLAAVLGCAGIVEEARIFHGDVVTLLGPIGPVAR